LIALLVDRSPMEVETVAQNIVECVARQAIAHAASAACDCITVSVGATLPCCDPEIAYSTLAHIADKALYIAKHQGRNRAILLGAVRTLDTENTAAGTSRPEARGLIQRTPAAIGTPI